MSDVFYDDVQSSLCWHVSMYLFEFGWSAQQINFFNFEQNHNDVCVFTFNKNYTIQLSYRREFNCNERKWNPELRENKNYN